MNMEKAVISVVVPVYNVIDYLEDCVRSILDQTWKEFELLLIDDGSTDGSAVLCDELSKTDSRIIVIHQKNGGLSNARNTGIRNAKGEYITFIDSDDYVNVRFLELLLNEISDKEIDMALCDYQKVYENTDFGRTHNSYENCIQAEVFSGKVGLMKFYTAYRHGINWMAWSKVYRLSLLLDNEIWFPEGKINEDVSIIHKTLYNSRNIVYVDLPLYYYRIRPNSIMTSVFTSKGLGAISDTRSACDFFVETKENELAVLAANFHIRFSFTQLYKYITSPCDDKDKALIIDGTKKQIRSDVFEYTRIPGFPLIKKCVYRTASVVPIKCIINQVKFK